MSSKESGKEVVWKDNGVPSMKVLFDSVVSWFDSIETDLGSADMQDKRLS